MNLAHTTEELVNEAFGRVENYIAMGVCTKCALIMTAKYYGCDQKKLEILWLDRVIEGDTAT